MLQKSDRGTVCSLLEKAGAEFSQKISLDRAVAKLQRYLDKRGAEFFLKKATTAQLKVLAELGCIAEASSDDAPAEEKKKEKKVKKEKAAEETSGGHAPRRTTFPTQPVVELVVRLLSKKKMLRKDLIEKIVEKFPDINQSTLSTLIADGGNPKYNNGRFPSLIQKDANRMLYMEA